MCPRRRRRLIAGGVIALTAAVAAPGCSSLTSAEPVDAASSWSVVGYAEAGSTSVVRLTANRSAITVLGVDGVDVTGDGAAITSTSPDALRLLHQAHAHHRSAELLVGNFDGGLDDFSPAIGDALLGSTSHIDAVTASLAAEVRQHGWDGITVDLESLSSAHPAGLTRFVTLLKKRLGAHRSVSICLMATTERYSNLGYDLRALGSAADHVVLMAYDQHGPTWSKPGPVGGTPWVKATLAPLLKAVPRQKIELGIAGYGYTWPAHRSGRQLSDSAARAEARRDGTGAHWDARQQEWHATTSDGTTLWWSDAKTIRARASYAHSHGLGGIAVWSLTLSDTIPNTH